MYCFCCTWILTLKVEKKKFLHCALEQRCWRVKMLGGRTMQREGDTCRQRHEYEIALGLKVET